MKWVVRAGAGLSHTFVLPPPLSVLSMKIFTIGPGCEVIRVIRRAWLECPQGTSSGRIGLENAGLKLRVTQGITTSRVNVRD